MTRQECVMWQQLLVTRPTLARASRVASASAAMALCNCWGRRTSFLKSKEDITTVSWKIECSTSATVWHLLGVEDTGYITIEHCLTNLLFLLFSSFFCPFIPYCFTSTVSSTPSRSLFMRTKEQSSTPTLFPRVNTFICSSKNERLLVTRVKNTLHRCFCHFRYLPPSL